MRKDPILDDLIKICSAFKFLGSGSCSVMINFEHLILLSKFSNNVSGLIVFEFNPAAKVKVLNTEPSSYTPFVILFK